MRNHKAAAIAVAMAFCAGSAQAQSTLGELMDKGFKKVEKADFAQAVFGAKLSGVDARRIRMVSQYKADGTVAGTWLYLPGGWDSNSGVFIGTWTIDDGGKVCSTTTALTAPAGISGSRTTCFFLFRSGDQYYGSPSDTDRAERVMVHTLTK